MASDETGTEDRVDVRSSPRLLAGLFAGLTALVCAALLIAAVLVPAPIAVLPFVIVACLGCPMAAAYELAGAVAAVRSPQLALRRELDRLPETAHPLDR